MIPVEQWLSICCPWSKGPAMVQKMSAIEIGIDEAKKKYLRERSQGKITKCENGKNA
jgi:hypothetical protein